VSAKGCWICGWLVCIADNQDVALATRISVGFDTDRIETLEPQELPYNDQNRQTTINRVALWVDRRQAGGGFEYKGFIQKAGFAEPKNVSDMLEFGHLIEVEPYTARLRPLMADTRLFKFWKDFCKSEHGELCGQSQLMSSRLRSMAYIRLVDVNHRCIVTLSPSEGLNWVALSYVWGEGQKHALTKENLTSYHQPGALNARQTPSTIFDAMTVTRDMGELYLWVDSLCIVQDDKEDKFRYIPAMDVIYGHAVFTIANAAVDKVSSSIPGIHDSSPRTTQDVFKINGTWLTASLDPPHDHLQGYLQKSRWNTRGWTYQEGLMTRRYLVFTPEQAYWQCLCASWCEDGFWEQRASEETIMYRHFLGKSIHQTTMRSLLGDDSTHWSKIYTMTLERYLQRQLTSEGDRLDALTGILRVLEHSRGQDFFWGMPKSRLELSLAWTGENFLIRNTARQSISSYGVTSPFPSWSWAGWLGSVDMDIDSTNEITGLLPLRFYRLGQDGNPVPVHDDFEDMVSQFELDITEKLGSDTVRVPRYPNTCEHAWMDTSKTEIYAPDVPSNIRSRDAAPTLLCFWTSTAILDISQELQPDNQHSLNTTISDGRTEIRGFWGWREPKLEVKRGKFIVIGGAVERPSHGGRLLLKLMLVGDEDGICYRRFLISEVLESSWIELENRQWEMVCLA
jgi:hypothetical protein